MGIREDFEEWAKGQPDINLKPENRFTDCYTYYYPDAELAWCAWHASRAALCVELPPELHAYTGQPQEDRIIDADRNHTIKQCRQAIESAGVKCK